MIPAREYLASDCPATQRLPSGLLSGPGGAEGVGDGRRLGLLLEAANQAVLLLTWCQLHAAEDLQAGWGWEGLGRQASRLGYRKPEGVSGGRRLVLLASQMVR